MNLVIARALNTISGLHALGIFGVTVAISTFITLTRFICGIITWQQHPLAIQIDDSGIPPALPYPVSTDFVWYRDFERAVEQWLIQVQYLLRPKVTLLWPHSHAT